MTTSEFFHCLDQRPSSHEQEAIPDSNGVVSFDSPSGYALAVAQLPDGRIDLFASPGYARSEMLQAILDEEGAPQERSTLMTVLEWYAHSARWTIEAHPDSGLVVLRATLAMPSTAAQWEATVSSFEAVYGKCEERLLEAADPQGLTPVGGSSLLYEAIAFRA